MCNFYHFIVHLICRFCARFSYTVIWKHSQFYVSVAEQLSLEQMNDNYFKSLARSHPCRSTAKTAVLLHLFVCTHIKKNREQVIGFLLNFESENLKNNVKPIKFSFISHNFMKYLTHIYEWSSACLPLCACVTSSLSHTLPVGMPLMMQRSNVQ